MKVTEIRMEAVNGYHYPVFIAEDGTEYRPRNTPTGSCWVIDWVPTKAKVEKSYYLRDDKNYRHSYWVIEFGDEIVYAERYSHQDENFSNLCSSSYCRCQQ